MRRAAGLLAAVALVVALAGCAPDAAGGTQRVEVEGEITAFESAAGGTGYLLDVPEQARRRSSWAMSARRSEPPGS